MYTLSINILEKYKRELEITILQHENDKMFIPAIESYDMDEDPDGHMEFLPAEVEVRKGHLSEVVSAIKFLKGDTREIQKFFENK